MPVVAGRTLTMSRTVCAPGALSFRSLPFEGMRYPSIRGSNNVTVCPRSVLLSIFAIWSPGQSSLSLATTQLDAKASTSSSFCFIKYCPRSDCTRISRGRITMLTRTSEDATSSSVSGSCAACASTQIRTTTMLRCCKHKSRKSKTCAPRPLA